MRRAALYLRVSTDQQTTEQQRTALEAAAAQRGWSIVATYADNGVSGARGRDKRPGWDAALKGATRGDYSVLMAWAVDRMGRSLQDLVNGLQELHAAGVDLFIHQQALDTTTPAGKAMFGMLGVFSEFERAMIQARVRAGLDRAKVQGTKTGNPFGRPKLSARKVEIARRALAGGASVRAAAKLAKISKSAAGKLAKAPPG
jgi:DNA invertase Pin-like site-specific DNA recombinase